MLEYKVMDTIYTSDNKIRKAIFLDRDGVINYNDKNYVQSVESVKLIPKSLEAIAAISKSDYAIVIVTNQSAIGRGIISEQTSKSINEHLLNLIHNANGRVDGLYVCPHHPKMTCPCRKPKPGMLLKASSDLKLNLNHSWLIGDAFTDIQAAIAAKTKPILVKTGRGNEQSLLLEQYQITNVPILNDLYDATKYIFNMNSI